MNFFYRIATLRYTKEKLDWFKYFLSRFRNSFNDIKNFIRQIKRVITFASKQ